jgi:hypothetical protein
VLAALLDDEKTIASGEAYCIAGKSHTDASTRSNGAEGQCAGALIPELVGHDAQNGELPGGEAASQRGRHGTGTRQAAAAISGCRAIWRGWAFVLAWEMACRDPGQAGNANRCPILRADFPAPVFKSARDVFGLVVAQSPRGEFLPKLFGQIINCRKSSRGAQRAVE